LFFLVVTLVSALVSLVSTTKPPILFLFASIAAVFLVLGVWVLVLWFLRRQEVILAKRFGFNDLDAYYEERTSRGWTDAQMAAELRCGVDWLRRASERWKAIKGRIDGLPDG
jgi:hypothetical protein